MAGRKPVHLTSSAGRIGGRQGIWQAIRKCRRFTVRQLAEAARAERSAAWSYVKCLVAGGILQPDGTEPAPRSAFGGRPNDKNQSAVYRLVKDCGVEAPRLGKDGKPSKQGLAREQMWRTMHLVSSFNARDLAVTASTEAVVVNLVDAKDYLQHLLRAGYLAIKAPSKPGHKPGTGDLAVYRLIKRTGPRPPMVQRMKTVFDPNLGQIVWHPEVEE